MCTVIHPLPRPRARTGARPSPHAASPRCARCTTTTTAPRAPPAPLLPLAQVLEGGSACACVWVGRPEGALAALERLAQQHLRLVEAAQVLQTAAQVGGSGERVGVGGGVDAAGDR